MTTQESQQVVSNIYNPTTVVIRTTRTMETDIAADDNTITKTTSETSGNRGKN